MASLKVFGMPSINHKMYITELTKEINKTKVEVDIQEIDDINEMMKAQISSIPSILFDNGLVMSKDTGQDLTDFFRSVGTTVRDLYPAVAKKKVLVGVDYSAASDHVLQAISHFLDRKSCSFHFFHAVRPYPSVYDATVVDMSPDLDQAKSVIEFKVQRYCEGVDSECEVVSGFATDEIISRSKDYDLIILGTTGAGQKGEVAFTLGSVSRNVAINAKCPVLLIPQDWQIKDLQRVLMAEGMEDKAFESTSWMLDQDKIDLTRIHVAQEFDYNLVFDATVLVTQRSIPDALLEEARVRQSDLVVLKKTKKNLIKKWIEGSTTNQVLRDAAVPILVLHQIKSCRCGGECKKSPEHRCHH